MKRLLVANILVFAAMTPATAVERLAVATEFSKVFEQSADGSWKGLGVDVLRALAAQAGDTVQFKMYPWPRAQAMVAAGQADILVGPYKSAEREIQYNFLDQPFYRDRMVFYARRGTRPLWNGDLKPLKHIRIAAVRGWHYGTSFDQARPRLSISDVPRLENGLQMLAYGRVDLLATNERNSEPVLDSLNLEKKLVALAPALALQDGYLAFPRLEKYAAVRERYNHLFNEMVRSGALARLGEKNSVRVPPPDQHD